MGKKTKLSDAWSKNCSVPQDVREEIHRQVLINTIHQEENEIETQVKNQKLPSKIVNININQQNLNKQRGRDDKVNTRVNFSFKIPERKDKRILKEGTVKATSAKSIFG